VQKIETDLSKVSLLSLYLYLIFVNCMYVVFACRLNAFLTFWVLAYSLLGIFIVSDLVTFFLASLYAFKIQNKLRIFVKLFTYGLDQHMSDCTFYC